MNIAFFARIYTAEVKHSILWVNMIIFRPTDFLLALVFVAKNCETLLTPTYSHLSIIPFRNQVMLKRIVTAGLKILTKVQTSVQQIFLFLES